MAKVISKKVTSLENDNSCEMLKHLDAIIGRLLPPSPRRSSQIVPISPQDGRALLWLGQNAPCVMSDLAKGVDVPLSTATHLVNRLVDKQLVVRRRSDNDRRIVEIELSELGKKLDKRFYDSRLAASRSLIEKLDDHEQAALLSLLDKMLAA